jgi:hypothetical protein
MPGRPTQTVTFLFTDIAAIAASIPYWRALGGRAR